MGQSISLFTNISLVPIKQQVISPIPSWELNSIKIYTKLHNKINKDDIPPVMLVKTQEYIKSRGYHTIWPILMVLYLLMAIVQHYFVYLNCHTSLAFELLTMYQPYHLWPYCFSLNGYYQLVILTDSLSSLLLPLPGH